MKGSDRIVAVKRRIAGLGEAHVRCGSKEDVLKNDCEIIEFLLDQCEIEIPEENRFFVKVHCGAADAVIRKRWGDFESTVKESGLTAGADALAYTGAYDFSHTSAAWESVISLGIYGLRDRIAEYARRKGAEEKAAFYQSLLTVYDAALRFLRRAAEMAAAHGRAEMAAGLTHLSEGRPSNLFEALQTSIAYYFLQFFFEGTALRTMGRPDSLLYSHYAAQAREDADGMLLDYIKEIDRLEAPANIPFALGGTDAMGRDRTNALSYALLECYRRADTKNTKLHLLCSRQTPSDLLKKALSCVREGKNSIVFLSDERVIESLEKQGVAHPDAVNYHVVGCYECGGNEELTCSCNARVNIPKALELALNRGRDMITDLPIGLENDGHFLSFEALWAEFERQLAHLCRCAMQLTDLYESQYPRIHSAPFLSGTYLSALEKGGDLYLDHAAKYNSSSLNAVGLATATDSLAAIRRAVYEEKALTLEEFSQILRSNWKDRAYLRLLIKNRYKKFGQCDKETDAIAVRIVDALADSVCRRPNAKGGKWRLGLFSIDWRWGFGKKTAASADGRLCGDPLSQNTGATFGAEREGATAHLRSVAKLDTSQTPNGAVVDIDLHSSAVRGENGLRALLVSLKTYFELGGFAVQYNVLDTEVLMAAKRSPERYPSLQVRLCGWNVLFSSLSDEEKDEFIARSMK